MLRDDQRGALLAAARASIAAHLRGEPADHDVGGDLPDASGVFVTLKRDGDLRGCLGVLRLDGTLADEVVRCARDSATRDPRFPPVSPEELSRLTLEISVLGPLEPIDPSAPDAVVIGRHGLVVEHGRHRGLLLPQVAVEWGWTREEFLRRTCRKAGLPDDAWRTGAQVWRFEADVFGE